MRSAERRVILGLYRARHDRDLLEAALELGITGLDTAYNYNKFSSRLRNAVGRSSDDLGRIPDVVLIHNPEQDPAALPGAAETMCQLQAHGMIKDS